MLITIFITLGLLGFTDEMFEKYYLWHSVEKILLKLSDLTGIKLIFNMAFCMFCQRFWISVILTCIVSAFSYFGWETIIVPFVVVGLYNVKSRK